MTARRLVALLTACASVAAVFLLWNLGRSPDTQYDEVVYSRADQAVAQDWSLTWTNRPLFVHPPLSFLAQAAWLRVLGAHDQPLVDVITDTRLLAALVSVVNVVLIALMTYRLAGRGRVVLTLVTAVLAATDPVLLRFGRMAMIEPFALLACLVTLHLAIWLHGRRSRWFVPVVGLAGGLTLLTNEVGIFMVLTPVVYALLSRDRRLVRQCLAALAAALALWSIFVLWAVQLGLLTSFVEVKTVTLQRLLGIVQTTGWNRPGVSLLSGLSEQLGQYVTSYVVLALGAVAPERVVAVHVNYLPTRPDPEVELSAADEARLDKVRRLMANRPPYQALQALTPQTIGYALTDSPVGQLVWIAERFAQWTDPATPVGDDRMLTDISLYWLTATAASSGRFHHDTPRGSRLPCRVPLGVAVFAHDITQSVRPLAERLYDVRHWSEFARGGHFAAMEVPDLFAEDVRAFFLRF